MPPRPTERIVRILEGLKESFAEHERDCGDRVVGIGLNPLDHDELGLVEVWGLPVLAWEEVQRQRFMVLCEAVGVLIPNLDTVEEIQEHWKFGLPHPSTSAQPL